MDLNKFTQKAQEALVGSQELARQLSHSQIEPEHLLVALVEQPEGIVPEVLRKMAVDPRRVAAAARTALQRRPQVYGGATPGLSPRVTAILDAAQADAARMKDEFVSTEHLLLALASEGARDEAARVLAQERSHRREGARGADRDPGLAAGHRPEPRGEVPGARALRPRPHRAGASRASSTR